MKEHPNLTQHEFDDLLNWMGPDRDAAGEMYILLSEGLNRYFRLKGCSDPENLVDETINRVAKKLTTIDTTTAYKPITYFYGFAKNVHLEYLAEKRRSPVELDQDDGALDPADLIRGQGWDDRLDCLDDCLDGLGADGSSVVMAYFEKDRGEKILARRELAENLQISLGSLHVRIHRLKAVIRGCMEKCLRAKESL